MKEKINSFITLGKKAKVLLGIDSNNEPRVSTMTTCDGRTTYTFNSTCFPFFSENEFETVDEKDVDLFIEKCSLFVKKLENDVKLEFDKKDYYIPESSIKYHKRLNPGKVSFLFRTKDSKFRITTTLCEEHKKDINNMVTKKNDHTCLTKLSIEELYN